MNRRNATTLNRQTDLENQLMEELAAKCTMYGEILALLDLIEVLEMKLATARLALEKLADESSKLEANLCAEMIAAEKALNA